MEITRMFELLTQPHIKERIKKVAHVIMPQTWWTGEKRKPGVLEVVKPGKVSKGMFKPVLHTGLKPVIYAEARLKRKVGGRHEADS